MNILELLKQKPVQRGLVPLSRKTFRITGLLLFGLLALNQVSAQQLIDNFNRSNSTTVGGGWTESENSSSGAQVNNNQLVLNGSSSGREYVRLDGNGVYNTTFSSNSGLMTWQFNMRQSRTDPSGFDDGNYGIAFILGGDNTSFNSGNGYAVALGSSSTTDNIRLVRYSNGMDGNSNTTSIITGSTDYSNEYFTLRVTFNPTGSLWSLYVFTSSSSFSDPTTAVYTQIGAATANSTHTSLNLRYYGCYWNHSSNSSDNAFFDNVYVPTLPPAPPTISLQPSISIAACEGSPASISAGATGTAPITVQWEKLISGVWTPIGGATATTYTISITSLADAGSYHAVFTNGLGSATTNAASLSVDVASIAGTTSPDATVCSGSNTGNIFVTGHNGTVVRWESSTNGGGSWSTISNTNTTYTFNNLNSTTIFRAVTRNGGCALVNSGQTTVTVLPSLAISAQPANTSLCDGGSAAFSITASGDGISYQWQNDSLGSYADITGATSNSITVNPVSFAMNGWHYRCVLNGTCGTLNSNPATLTVVHVSEGGTLNSSATVCAGNNSGTLTLSGQTGNVVGWEVSTDGGSNWTPLNVGHIGTQTSTNDNGFPFHSGENDPSRHQYLYLASELLASGLGAGNLTSFGVTITNLGSGSLTNYTIGMAQTASTSLTSTFNTGPFTTVYVNPSQSYVSGLNTFVFNTPYNWDGVSNILINICYDNPNDNNNSDGSLYSTSAVRNLGREGSSTACTNTSSNDTYSNLPVAVFTGSSINYSNLLVSTQYRAIVKNGVCSSTTSVPAIITIDPLSPTVFTLTGGGSYCSNMAGVEIGLDGSQIGVDYQVKNGAVNVGSPVAGTGSALSLGILPAGTYTVVATNTTSLCSRPFAGSVTVSATPAPSALALASPSSICEGASTNLSCNGGSNGASPQTFNAAVNTAIPNQSSTGFSSTIVVAGAPATIAHVSVRILVTHQRSEDVEVYLVRPGGALSTSSNGNFFNDTTAGQSVCLVADRGGSGTTGFSNTVFSDAASTTIGSGSNPYAGSYKPENALSTLTGNPNGTWTLKVLDDGGSSTTGTFVSWSLTIDCLNGQSFTWSSTPAGFSSSDQNPGAVTPAVPTTYTVLVTDLVNNCTATSSVPVSFYPAISLSTSVVNDVHCVGGNDGSAMITASGGTPPFSGDGLRTGLSAGVHTFTVTDASNCSATCSVTINDPAVAFTAIATGGVISCNGGFSTLNISGENGTPPYLGEGPQFVTAGPYSYTITDANNCIATVSGTITEPDVLEAAGVEGPICFGGTTTVTITATGGTLPYTGDGVHVVSPGPYIFVVSDANGCNTVVAGTIIEPALLTASAVEGTILCNGGTTTVTITPAGGTAPYTNDGEHTVSAGPYSFTITDANGCTTVVSGTISEPEILAATALDGNILCNGGTTTVEITATGGTIPYTNDGAHIVSVGPYSFTITDANGCSTTVTGSISEPEVLTVSSVDGVILCNGATTTVTVTAIGGTTPYSNDGDHTVSAGPYSITVTDANGCTAVAAGYIGEPSSLTGSATEGTILCHGDFTTVNITGSDGTPPYSNEGLYTVPAGPYSFTISDANGCSFAVTGTINEPDALTASTVEGSILCNGGSTTVTINATGGTAPYTGDGDHTVSAGPYSFVVMDANGCSTEAAGTMTEPDVLTASSVDGSILCYGGSATVTITAAGGTTPYTNDGDHTVTAGPYSFTVTDVNGCSAEVTGFVSEPNQLTASAVDGAISCNGGTAEITITAEEGTPPYSGDGVHTVSAGPYSFIVSDANGCSVEVTGNVGEPDGLSASAVEGSILCNGGTTTVTISATGGTAPYTGEGEFTVSAGSYSFTVSDANNCSTVVTGSISEPDALTASALEGNILCNGGTTTITITATGGTQPYSNDGEHTVSAGPYSFMISDFNGCTFEVSGNISEPDVLAASAIDGAILCNGGTTLVSISATGGTLPYSNDGDHTVSVGPYSFIVTDFNGCSVEVTGSIGEPELLTASATEGTILCSIGTTTVTITAAGGTAPYSGDGDHTVSAGPYSFIVTDNNGCTTEVNGTISEPDGLSASAVEGSILCNGGTTTLTITATGGTAPYTGEGDQTVSAGPYSFQVSDFNGCITFVNGNITEPEELKATADEGTILCNGGTTTVTITATGGTEPYTGDGEHTVSAGPYSFQVTDANGCSTLVEGNITEPELLTASVSSETILCNGGTVTLTVIAAGGTPLYVGDGEQVISAGPYNFIVSDANGCTATVSGTMSEPDALTATADISPLSNPDGTTTVTVTATGGTAPYTGEGSYDLQPGPYNLTVTDANGCSAAATGSVTQRFAFDATAVVGTILCHGGTTTVTITATGGTPPYTNDGEHTVSAGQYSITVSDADGRTIVLSGTITEPDELTASAVINPLSNPDGTTTVTITATGGTAPYSGDGAFDLQPGSFTLTVTDANGCSTIVTGSVNQRLAFDVTAVEGHIKCNGGTTTVTITATGGVQPYSNDGIHTVSAGAYSFTVTDAQGSSQTVTGFINEPDPLIATADEGVIYCNGGTTDVFITADGGTPPYIGTGHHTVSEGHYSFVVMDKNHCSIVVSGYISAPVYGLELTATVIQPRCCGDLGKVSLNISGGTPYYYFNNTPTEDLESGWYTYVVTDANGCQATATVRIEQAPRCITGVTSVTTATCSGNNGSATVVAHGGSGNYTNYSWNCSPNQNTCTATGLAPGIYTVIITDSRGCTGTATACVPNIAPPQCSISGRRFICPGGTTTLTASSGMHSYHWNTGETTSSIEVSMGGAYSVTVENQQGCSSNASITVNSPMVITCLATNGNCSNGYAGSASVSVNNGSAPYTYSWNNGSTSANITALAAAGTYDVQVTDVNGCTISGNTNVSMQVSPSDYTAAAGNFNKATIAAGKRIWFNNSVRVKASSYPVTIRFINQQITGSMMNIVPANAKLIITPAVTQAVTVFTGTEWITTAPPNVNGKYFLSGYSYMVPANIPSQLTNVSWTGIFAASTSCMDVEWQWAAAVYNYLPSNMNLLGVKPVDGDVACQYHNTDQAGTPEDFKQELIAGARSGGGVNFTGAFTKVLGVRPCSAVACDNAHFVQPRDNSRSITDGQVEDVNSFIISEYPNPFTTTTTIEFQSTDKGGHTLVEIYTLSGSKVVTLFEGNIDAGEKHQVEFNAEKLGAGVYVYKIFCDQNMMTGKLILMK